MRDWKQGGVSVAVLGAIALVIGASGHVSGQQRSYAYKNGDGTEQHVIVRQQRGPLPLARMLEPGGVRLGVTIRDITANDVATLKLASPSGVLIDDVEKDTPAAKGGVLKGDVALVFDGETVRSVAQFTRLVRESAPGRAVKMAVMREGKRTELSVTPDVAADQDVSVLLDEARMPRNTWEFRVPSPEGMPRPDTAPLAPTGPMRQFRWEGEPGGNVFAFSAGRGRLGVQAQDLSPDLAEFFGVKAGALVSTVQRDTPAAKAGVKAGDVITAVDGKSVSDASELVDQLRGKSGVVVLTVMRDKKALTLNATLKKEAAPQKPKVVIQSRPS